MDTSVLRHTIWVVFILTGAAGCGGEPSSGKQSISVDIPSVGFDNDGYQTTMSDADIAAYNARFDALFHRSGATGLTSCIYSPNTGLWQASIGVEDTDSQIPISSRSLFHAGSVGKMVTASLILKLIEDQHFSLHTPISQWFPESLNAQSITIDHLLNHTSGLPANINETDGESMTPEEKALRGVDQKLQFEPGRGFSYSNTGYFVLGVILEMIHAQALSELFTNAYIRNLDLEHTQALTTANHADILIGSAHDGQIDSGDFDYASPGGAGILATNACDLIRMINILLARQFLNDTTITAMGARFYPMSATIDMYWSRGLMVLDFPADTEIGRVFYLAGRIRGFGAAVIYHPILDTFIAVMVNDDTQVDPILYQMLVAVQQRR